jgi:hypothetical protein
MKYTHINMLAVLLLSALGLSSCSFITGVFKTGVGVGVLLVVLLIVGVIALIGRAGKK